MKVTLVSLFVSTALMCTASAVQAQGDPVPGPGPGPAPGPAPFLPTAIAAPTPPPEAPKIFLPQPPAPTLVPLNIQANPAISPLDQRSGLTNSATGTTPSTAGLTITSGTPNISNSNLLAPSGTQASSNINSKPSFDFLGPLLKNLLLTSMNTPTFTDNRTTEAIIYAPAISNYLDGTPADRIKFLNDNITQTASILNGLNPGALLTGLALHFGLSDLTINNLMAISMSGSMDSLKPALVNAILGIGTGTATKEDIASVKLLLAIVECTNFPNQVVAYSNFSKDIPGFTGAVTVENMHIALNKLYDAQLVQPKLSPQETKVLGIFGGDPQKLAGHPIDTRQGSILSSVVAATRSTQIKVADSSGMQSKAKDLLALANQLTGYKQNVSNNKALTQGVTDNIARANYKGGGTVTSSQSWGDSGKELKDTYGNAFNKGNQDIANAAKSAGNSIASGAKTVGNVIAGGAKAAGSAIAGAAKATGSAIKGWFGF